MTPAPYGYCPVCGEPGATRERRPSGNDRCERGHTYPSSTAMESTAPTCATCRFHRDGRCYRYPPSPERGRPLVASDDFCGEWGSP